MGRAEDIFSRIVQEGLQAIEGFVVERKTEELFLDFKRSADNGNGERFHQNDRNNLAKAVSGFGNSEGGVIVWGVDCRNVRGQGDVPSALHPISNVRRFVSWIEGAISGCTVPPHSGVKNAYIISDGENGYVITLIPKSQNTPHQAIPYTQYYIRAGSDFMPTPHSVLQGMFGRRPQPFVYVMYSTAPARIVGEDIQIKLGFIIGNHGPGIASDLFMNLKYSSVLGPNCELQTERRTPTSWSYGSIVGALLTAMSSTEYRIGPEQFANPFIMDLILKKPFDRDLLIEGLCGCGQAPAWKFVLENSREDAERMFDNLIDISRQRPITSQEGRQFVHDILNIRDDLIDEDRVPMPWDI